MQFVDDASSTDSDTLVASSELSVEEDDLEDLRKKFVGEIDVPESTSLLSSHHVPWLIPVCRRGASAQRLEASFRALPHSISRGEHILVVLTKHCLRYGKCTEGRRIVLDCRIDGSFEGFPGLDKQAQRQ
jgi:hypothetical protein